MAAHPEALLSPWFVARGQPAPEQPAHPDREALREVVVQRLAQRLGIDRPVHTPDRPSPQRKEVHV